MADSFAPPLRPSLLPPDPRAGRRRFGPTLLLLAGIASVGVVFAYRDRLRPAPASAASRVERPTVAETIRLFGPLAEIVAPPAAAPSPVPTWPTVAAAAPTVPPSDPFAGPAAAPAAVEPVRFRLQSIVVGRRGGACLINGKACRVGDEVNGATVRTIERGRVVLRIDGVDVELRLAPIAGAGVHVTAGR